MFFFERCEKIRSLWSKHKSLYRKNLKIFGKAVVSSQKAALRNVGNNIINTYKQLQSDIYIHKLNKEIARKKLHELNAEMIREEINNG